MITFSDTEIPSEIHSMLFDNLCSIFLVFLDKPFFKVVTDNTYTMFHVKQKTPFEDEQGFD